MRVARAGLGLTQEKVALAADMDQSQNGRIARRAVDPGVRTAARIARALHVTMAQLYEDVEAAGNVGVGRVPMAASRGGHRAVAA